MTGPTIKTEISIGSMVSWVGIVITIIGVGIAIGQDRSDIVTLKTTQIQSTADSRSLIRLQADVEYIKKAVDEIRAAGVVATKFACPDDQPILVASYCRGRPLATTGE